MKKIKKIYKSNSQASQESFVVFINKICGYQKKKTLFGEKQEKLEYVEIGSYHPKTLSNTYILERYFKYYGIAFEIDEYYAALYNSKRNNKCYCLDATEVDYEKYFKDSKLSSRIGYLQIDVDPAEQSLKVLKKIPFDKYTFNVITFEHDQYRDIQNIEIAKESRTLLSKMGYELIFKNIMYDGNPFEDWWVHGGIDNIEKIRKLKHENIEHKDIFSINIT